MRSATTSSATRQCRAGTRDQNTVTSLSVAAFTTPPLLSISWLISAAVGRFAVPLKTMCSRKWPVPAFLRSSSRDPAPTKTESDAERASGISETSTRTPLGSTRFSYSIVGTVTGEGAPGARQRSAAEHHRHVQRVAAFDRADADAAERWIHDVRAVIDRGPRLRHELDVEGRDVVVPDLAGVLAVPAGPARGDVARRRRAVRAVVIDVPVPRFGSAVCACGSRRAVIGRERDEPTCGARRVDELQHPSLR